MLNPTIIHLDHQHVRPPKSYPPIQAPVHQNRPIYTPRPRPNPEARTTLTYTHIAKPLAQLFERLRSLTHSLKILMEISDALITRHQDSTFGLGYEPTVGRACNMQSEKKVFIPERVPALAQGITLEPDECITEGIENLFIAMTEEDYGE
ncbi:hypothetical protein HAX54_018548 [Datura stramonium]|uniref:Uncharacterized protein n=1 Tax=Datura stramonium TaxID=4076 RepID=A0ABS8UPY4_DATST|nr:hypothetical protein [Datura stramonium]